SGANRVPRTRLRRRDRRAARGRGSSSEGVRADRSRRRSRVTLYGLVRHRDGHVRRRARGHAARLAQRDEAHRAHQLPRHGPTMDALSDLLRIVRLDGAYFYAVDAAHPWNIEAVAARQMMPRIMPAAEHLISYHILTEGSCYGGLLDEEPVEMKPGDVIVFPH